ncbi:MAG: hypothetical protein WA948_08800 [Pontixanthobacter sp.]
MNAPRNPNKHTDLRGDVAAAFEWWATAGVDCDFTDDVTAWLAPNTPTNSDDAPNAGVRRAKPAAPRASPVKKFAGEPGDWPGTVGEFQQWWRESSEVDDAGSYPIVGPRGASGAAIMIIVGEPEENDDATLLSDAQGRLVANILRAMGTPPETAYFASVLRRHTPLPDWTALAQAGVGDLLAHHVKLVSPARVVTFGRTIPPLLGHDMAQGAPLSFEIGEEDFPIPTLAAPSLAELLRSGPRRKRFWNNWLNWT